MNESKTKCMVFRCSRNKKEINYVAPFVIGSKQIDFVNSFRYLGYIIMDNMNIKDDVNRAMNKFYADINMILRKFNYADKEVKLYLFKQYCLQIYGGEFWLGDRVTGSSATLRQFSVGYHKAIKKLLHLSSHESNHFACQEANVFTFKHFINKLKIMSTLKLLSKPCAFLAKILDYMYISSFFVNEVFNILEKEYGIDSITDNDKDAIISRICFIQNHEKQMRLCLGFCLNLS